MRWTEAFGWREGEDALRIPRRDLAALLQIPKPRNDMVNTMF